jgi:hypothetical protein
MKELIEETKRKIEDLYLTGDIQDANELKDLIDKLVQGAFNEGIKTGNH